MAAAEQFLSGRSGFFLELLKIICNGARQVVALHSLVGSILSCYWSIDGGEDQSTLLSTGYVGG